MDIKQIADGVLIFLLKLIGLWDGGSSRRRCDFEKKFLWVPPAL